jgi:hypothetical protein
MLSGHVLDLEVHAVNLADVKVASPRNVGSSERLAGSD